MNDSDYWPWVWLIAMAVLGLGEVLMAGTLFLAPFALGAAVAGVLALLGTPLWLEWIAFFGVSGVTLIALRPLAHRFNDERQAAGVGAGRQIGRRATVVEAIDPENDRGMVRLRGDTWRAESANGEVIPDGTTVQVTEILGTRLVVTPNLDNLEETPEVPDSPTPNERN